MRSDIADPSVSDAMRNEVITKLRQQYLENTQRATSLSARYGPEHGVVTRLRSDNANIVASIKDELRRIEESYRSEYEVARGRERRSPGVYAAFVDETPGAAIRSHVTC